MFYCVLLNVSGLFINWLYCLLKIIAAFHFSYQHSCKKETLFLLRQTWKFQGALCLDLNSPLTHILNKLIHFVCFLSLTFGLGWTLTPHHGSSKRRMDAEEQTQNAYLFYLLFFLTIHHFLKITLWTSSPKWNISIKRPNQGSISLLCPLFLHVLSNTTTLSAIYFINTLLPPLPKII